jgi:hypothetical protein
MENSCTVLLLAIVLFMQKLSAGISSDKPGICYTHLGNYRLSLLGLVSMYCEAN